MITAQTVLNSLVFWSAWIIIPVIMEIIPALGCAFLLIRRRFRARNADAELTFWPEITLIIPVYNSAKTLANCIRSVDECAYPSEQVRIFLVDNGSKDDSFSVFGRAQEAHPDLRMQWLNAQSGKSKALNLALYNSEGKYIINIDSDGVLAPNALTNLVRKFEAHTDINVMTGAVLIEPRLIEEYRNPFARLLRKLEFMEYAQAFLAGRSYSSETDTIYTLSGAFSAFRKSAVLNSRLYNTNTLAEDTQLTFQMRYLYGEKVEMCEDAIFYVDPIDDVNKLYTQRQRWQRGSLEVAKLFHDEHYGKMRPWRFVTDANMYALLFDHTFAFPRMIWYVALLCLMALNFSPYVIALSILFIFALYILVGYVYFACVLVFLKREPGLRSYYARQWWVVALLPFFNLGVFFIRFAGVINSIGTDSVWRTKTLSDEGDDFRAALRDTLAVPARALRRARAWMNPNWDTDQVCVPAERRNRDQVCVPAEGGIDDR